MIEKRLFLLLVFITCSISAQIKGVVKDSLTGKPIPYVNIWVENENIGSTSEENGTFSINTTAKGKRLIFSFVKPQCPIFANHAKLHRHHPIKLCF